MILYAFEFFSLKGAIWSLECSRFAVHEEIVFKISILVALVFFLILPGQLQIDINHLSSCQMRILLIQVVHDEEVACLALPQINLIYETEGWLLTVDDVAEMIACVEDIVIGIDEHLGFASDSDFQSNKEQALLLVQDHAHIFEFESFELTFFQRYLVQLIFGARLVVVHPYAAFLQDFHYFQLIGRILILVDLV